MSLKFFTIWLRFLQSFGSWVSAHQVQVFIFCLWKLLQGSHRQSYSVARSWLAPFSKFSAIYSAFKPLQSQAASIFTGTFNRNPFSIWLSARINFSNSLDSYCSLCWNVTLHALASLWSSRTTSAYLSRNWDCCSRPFRWYAVVDFLFRCKPLSSIEKCVPYSA